MLRNDINRLLKEFGVKQEAIISQIGSNRVTFGKKLKDNSFDRIDKMLIHEKWGALL